jgi:beta-glucanase (GH16 family)
MKHVITFFISSFYLISILNAQCKINYNDWQVVFEDNFNYTNTSQMTTNWRFDYPWACGKSLLGNSFEAQYYDQSQVSVSNGLLYLNAVREDITYNCVDDGGIPQTKQLLYRSGMIHFNNVVDPVCWPGQLGHYLGMFEIRCKMPNGQGVWPAFWLYNGRIEVDIFEGSGPRAFSSTIHRHEPAATSTHCSQYLRKETGLDLNQEFHTYTGVWTPNKITIFFDGKELYSINTIASDLTCPAGIITNLGMINSASWSNPQGTVHTMTIDYIKVYKPLNGNYTLPYKTTNHWGKHPMESNPPVSSQISSSNGGIAVYKNNNNEVFYRGSDNKLHRYYLSGGNYIHEIIPSGFNYTSNQLIAGDVVTSQFDGQNFYRGGDGRLQIIYYSGGTFHHGYIDDFWSTTAYQVSSNPGSIVLGSGNQVFYRGTDNKLHRFYWNVNDWAHELLPANFSYSSTQYISGDMVIGANNHIFYRGADGRIQSLGKSGASWIHGWVDDAWSTTAYMVSSAYGSMSLVGNGNEFIFYRGTDNKLHRYYWSSSVNDWVHELILVNGSSITINGKLSAVYNSSTGNFQIFYRGTDNKMNIVYTDNGIWYHDWLSSWGYLSPETTMSGDNFFYTGTKIFYKKSDNYIGYFSWESCENLNPVCVDNSNDYSRVYKKQSIDQNYTNYDPVERVTLFPNPSTGIFKLNWDNQKSFKVEIIDCFGKLILEKQCSEENIDLNLSNEKEGIYLLKLSNGHEIVSKTIVLKK